MSSGARTPFRQAFLAAVEAVNLIWPALERAEICGSLRRLERDVGDIELVVVPKLGQVPTGDLFGTTQPGSLLELRVAEPLRAGAELQPHPTDPKNGPKYKKLWLRDPGIQIDLFVVRPDQWGPAVAIRTGPASFSKSLVTELLKRGLRCDEQLVKRGAEVVPCPDERTFFRLCGRPYFPPEART